MPQKPRSASGDEVYALGRHLVKDTCDCSTMAEATTGAALARLHIEQWQIAAMIGSPVIWYRTLPHWQPPLKLLFDLLENSQEV